MTDEDEHDESAPEEHDHGESVDEDHDQDEHEEQGDTEHAQSQAVERNRVTAPMQDFSTSQVTTGFVVLLVGVAIAYLLPSLV